MIEEYVGKENLPNVFIDRVEIQLLETPTTLNPKMNVTLCIYDEIDPTWSGGKIPDLEVSLVAVTDAEKNEKIKTGSHPGHSFYDSDFDPLSITRTFMASSFTEVPSPSLPEGLKKFTKEVTMLSPNVLNRELNIYCFSTLRDLGFEIPEFDKFCGPVAGEEIYKSNSFVESSGYFFDPETNLEYGGPVYIKESKYYKGSFEAETAEEVFFVPETNMKIITEGSS